MMEDEKSTTTFTEDEKAYIAFMVRDVRAVNRRGSIFTAEEWAGIGVPVDCPKKLVRLKAKVKR